MVEASTLWNMTQQVNILNLNTTTYPLPIALGLTLPIMAVLYGIATLLSQDKNERDLTFVILLITAVPYYSMFGVPQWAIYAITITLTVIALVARWKKHKD